MFFLKVHSEKYKDLGNIGLEKKEDPPSPRSQNKCSNKATVRWITINSHFVGQEAAIFVSLTRCSWVVIFAQCFAVLLLVAAI